MSSSPRMPTLSLISYGVSHSMNPQNPAPLVLGLGRVFFAHASLAVIRRTRRAVEGRRGQRQHSSRGGIPRGLRCI